MAGKLAARTLWLNTGHQYRPQEGLAVRWWGGKRAGLDRCGRGCLGANHGHLGCQLKVRWTYISQQFADTREAFNAENVYSYWRVEEGRGGGDVALSRALLWVLVFILVCIILLNKDKTINYVCPLRASVCMCVCVLSNGPWYLHMSGIQLTAAAAVNLPSQNHAQSSPAFGKYGTAAA